MKSLTFLSLVFVTFVLFACKSDSTSPNNTTTYTIEDIFPLIAGNYLSYATADYDTSGTIINIDTVTFSIDSSITFNGKPAFAVNLFGRQIINYYDGSDIFSVIPPGDHAQLVLRYPSAVGEVVTIRDSTYDTGERERRVFSVVADKVPIVVPAGNFDCIHYQFIYEVGFSAASLDTSSVVDQYFAPGVGMVSSDSYTFINKKRKLSFTHRLIDYIK